MFWRAMHPPRAAAKPHPPPRPRVVSASGGCSVPEMEWEWYHYVGCILLGIAFKLFKRAVGMDRPRGQMFRQQEDVVLSSKRVN